MDQDGINADEGENMEIEPENFIVNDEILDSHSYGVNKVIPCELCQQMFTNKVSLCISIMPYRVLIESHHFSGETHTSLDHQSQLQALSTLLKHGIQV